MHFMAIVNRHWISVNQGHLSGFFFVKSMLLSLAQTLFLADQGRPILYHMAMVHVYVLCKIRVKNTFTTYLGM